MEDSPKKSGYSFETFKLLSFRDVFTPVLCGKQTNMEARVEWGGKSQLGAIVIIQENSNNGVVTWKLAEVKSGQE